MYVTITARRREIIRWLALGKTCDEIAQLVGTSTYTVKNNIGIIARAYGALAGSKNNTRTMIVVAALIKGDLALDQVREEYLRAINAHGYLLKEKAA